MRLLIEVNLPRGVKMIRAFVVYESLATSTEPPMTPPEGIFAGFFGRGRGQRELSDLAFVQAMLDFELALLRALVRAGLAPAEAAEQLAAAADATSFEPAALGRSTGEHGTPVPGLLAALRDRAGDVAAAHLHRGATSQDVVDTALMLVAKRALVPLIEDLHRGADSCAAIADRHRGSLVAGRTLLQQASPLSFGLKAAGWLVGLDEARRELTEVRDHVLAVQLGGSVGSLAALGDSGIDVVGDVARQLSLAEPVTPWHTIRLRPARLAAALGSALGVMGKIARDVTLLSQNEVGELSEGGSRGRSSTMPHKRNPVGAVAILACAERGPGLVATILATMVQEHERAAGAWQAEAETLSELLRLTLSAADCLRELATGLEVDPARMRENLDTAGTALMTESLADALTGHLGRGPAGELVAEAVRRAAGEHRPLADVLPELTAVNETLGQAGLAQALDPERYLGVAGRLIDRALLAHGLTSEP